MSQHAGPAGSTFNNIEHAGKHTLQVNCDNYPQTNSSYILPPLFISTYPEGNDPATSQPVTRVNPPLSGDEQRKFQGICSGQGGEQTEKKVFYLLTKLLEKQQNHSMLVLRDFEMNTKGKTNLKRTTLMAEYPQIQNINMRGEADYIVLLKDLGFVCIEVKRTLDATSLQKAKEQLDRSELFLNELMPAVAPNSHSLPVVKLIMFEMDPQNLITSNSLSIYSIFNCSGISTGTFNAKVEDLKRELHSRSPPNPLTPPEFKRLARLLTGLWSMKSLNRQPYFDVNEASLPGLTTQVDDRVNHAELSSGQLVVEGLPVTNVVHNQDETVFRKSNEISLMYLTPQQKNIYDNVPRGIIRGAAGTGKTLLILFKIIELVQSPNDNRKILLIAPHPHTIRCKNILQANNITVVVEGTDYSPVYPYNVVIMDGIEVFKKDSSFAISDFSSYHIFIDDLQNILIFSDGKNSRSQLPEEEYKANNVILPILDDAYKVSTRNLSYFWCMVDELQNRVDDRQKMLYTTMFSNVTDVDVTNVKIPVYILEGILRNTEEISKVVLTARAEFEGTMSKISNTAVEAHSSHNITSSLPIYHRLRNPLRGKPVYDNRNVKLIEDELREYLHSTNPLPLSEIAILYDGPDHTDHVRSEMYTQYDKPDYKDLVRLKEIREMLSNAFNIVPMTIEDQLNSRSSTIVLDEVNNVMSGEWAFVILLRNSHLSWRDYRPYRGYSRARTRLVIIDSSKYDDGYPFWSEVKLVGGIGLFEQ